MLRRARYRILPRSCSARAAAIAVFTCLRSSGGGKQLLQFLGFQARDLQGGPQCKHR